MAKILLIEDDKSLSSELKDWLHRQEHHTIDQAFTAGDAVHFLKTYAYDAIVLDWELPDFSGVEILRRFRGEGKVTPVLMLTGRSAIIDKTTGLDTGSDDYLTKPFQPEELAARLRALLRRPAGDQTDRTIVTMGPLKIDSITRKVLLGMEEVKFQPAEFDLLHFLATNPNRVFSITQLLGFAWADNERASEASLRVSLSRIRKKINDNDRTPIIENLPGQGYRLNNPDI